MWASNTFQGNVGKLKSCNILEKSTFKITNNSRSHIGTILWYKKAISRVFNAINFICKEPVVSEHRVADRYTEIFITNLQLWIQEITRKLNHRCTSLAWTTCITRIDYITFITCITWIMMILTPGLNCF